MNHSQRLQKHPKHGPPEYWRAHEAAITTHKPGFEASMVGMLRGWLAYADAHRLRYESGIDDDGFLGPEWDAIGQGLRGLLNGELGRLDAGALDAIINDTRNAEGFTS